MKPFNALKLLFALAIFTLSGVPAAGAEPALRLANCQGNSMVLQRDMPVPVWGWAPAKTEVTVTFKGQRKVTTADADGRWLVTLDPLKADVTPASLSLAGSGTTVVANDVLVGDVWLCAGPGIMRNMGVLSAAKTEIAKAKFPLVRILRPDAYTSQVPVADIPSPARWWPATADNIARFSIAWYIGRELHLEAKVPVGLVLANFEDGSPRDWQAWKLDPANKEQANDLKSLAKDLAQDLTRTEAWLAAMDRRSPNDPIDLLLFPSYIKYSFYSSNPTFDGPYPYNHTTSINYNALIHPLRPMALRGVFLFNEYNAKSYTVDADIKSVIASWREAWGRPGLPFIIPEPVLAKHERVKQITAAITAATNLPGVVLVPKPTTFSDQQSDGYWLSLAKTAQTLAVDTPPTSPALEQWTPIVPVEPAASAKTNLELGHLFMDNMVLQCNQPIKVWGWAKTGETVQVTFSGQTQQAVADAAGKWQVSLPAHQASSEPSQMIIKGASETMTLNNIVVGEVWINSGQSNAGYGMVSTFGFDEEQPKATYPALRYFVNVRASNILPQRRNLGRWVVVSPETVGKMSGMGYYFARSLYQNKQVPVGIIEANHGGSSIISWVSDAVFASSPAFQKIAADRAVVREESQAVLPVVVESVRAWVTEARKNAALTRPVAPFPIDASSVRPFYTSFLQNPMERRGSMFYNGMIYPMIGYGARGVLWNQGEADTGSISSGPAIYDDLMAAMVADWRKSWGMELAFYYVQMPAIKDRTALMNMWQAQTRALAKISHSGMSISNDISEAARGEAGIHPRNKKAVGERLARLALVRTYGVKDMIDSSPLMQSVERHGAQVVVTFAPAGTSLKTRDGKAADWWELAGADGKFVKADAVIAGNKVTVTAAGVSNPSQVQLGWKEDSDCNLVNSADLPAMPFSAPVPVQ